MLSVPLLSAGFQSLFQSADDQHSRGGGVEGWRGGGAATQSESLQVWLVWTLKHKAHIIRHHLTMAGEILRLQRRAERGLWPRPPHLKASSRLDEGGKSERRGRWVR
jgi:hypothetical protein